MKQSKEHIHQITDTYDLDKEKITLLFLKKQAHLVTYCHWARHVSSYAFEDSKENLCSNSINLCQTAINLEVICFDN